MIPFEQEKLTVLRWEFPALYADTIFDIRPGWLDLVWQFSARVCDEYRRVDARPTSIQQLLACYGEFIVMWRETIPPHAVAIRQAEELAKKEGYITCEICGKKPGCACVANGSVSIRCEQHRNGIRVPRYHAPGLSKARQEAFGWAHHQLKSRPNYSPSDEDMARAAKEISEKTGEMVSIEDWWQLTIGWFAMDDERTAMTWAKNRGL